MLSGRALEHTRLSLLAPVSLSLLICPLITFENSHAQTLGHWYHLEGLPNRLMSTSPPPHTQLSYLVDLGWGEIICISNKSQVKLILTVLPEYSLRTTVLGSHLTPLLSVLGVTDGRAIGEEARRP